MADSNGTSIKVARFSGTEKFDILERNELGRCCLLKSAFSVLEKLNVANSTVVRVGEKAQRTEMRLVNPQALREAVLNAIIHNDYIGGAYPVFEIYDDRIEVISSGGLPLGLSETEFFEGRSLPRNKELMRIFSDMDLCEQLGSGMRKILRTYPKTIFHISEHFLDVKFMYDEKALSILNDENTTGGINGGVNGGVNITDKENTIISYLRNNNTGSASEISANTGIPKRTVERTLKSLKDKGLIERIGSDKTGFWKVND